MKKELYIGNYSRDELLALPRNEREKVLKKEIVSAFREAAKAYSDGINELKKASFRRFEDGK